jgi:hypothetical protein
MMDKDLELLIDNVDFTNLYSDIKVQYKKIFFPESFIERFSDKYSLSTWNLICKTQKLSESFIEKHKDKFDRVCWNYIARHQKISISFIKKHLDKFDKASMNCVAQYQKLSTQFICEYRHLLGKDISYNKYIKHYDISKIYSFYDLRYAIKNCSDSQIDFVLDKCLTNNKLQDISDILDSCDLKEKFLDKLLSGNNRVSGMYGLYRQKLSNDFIIKHQKIIDFHMLFCNRIKDIKNIIDNISLDLLDDECWNNIAHHQTLDLDFIKSHMSRLNPNILLRRNFIKNKKMIKEIYKTYSDLL